MFKFVGNFNGEILDGYDVHHRDFNHDDNDISNLELLTKDEHEKLHATIKTQQSPPKKSKFDARNLIR